MAEKDEWGIKFGWGYYKEWEERDNMKTGTETGTVMHICILNRPLLFAGTF